MVTINILYDSTFPRKELEICREMQELGYRNEITPNVPIS